MGSHAANESHTSAQDSGAIQGAESRMAGDPVLSSAARAFLDGCRVAHLATGDAAGAPHVVPVCFACDWAPVAAEGESSAGWRIYSVIDAKPKRASPLRLKRVRNVLENPRVALVADRYDEDWSRLGYVLVTGSAMLVTADPLHARALTLLRAKYPQYRSMALEDAPVLMLVPERCVTWGDLGA